MSVVGTWICRDERVRRPCITALFLLVPIFKCEGS